MSSKYKPHNPPILWKRSRCCLISRGGGGGHFMERYLVSLWVSCEHILDFGIPMGSFSSKFWYPDGSKFLAWSAHPYPLPEEDNPPTPHPHPPPPPPPPHPPPPTPTPTPHHPTTPPPPHHPHHPPPIKLFHSTNFRRLDLSCDRLCTESKDGGIVYLPLILVSFSQKLTALVVTDESICVWRQVFGNV